MAPAYLRRQQRRYLRDLTSYLRRLSRHVVLIDSQSEAEAPLLPLLRRTVAVALEAEAVEEPCEINILLTDDKGIRQTNREMRGVDKPTDVLSFPMFDLTPPAGPQKAHLDPATALVPLGDMCISLQRAKAQAREYGHSLERETAYLAVHSVLHLLGYDHVDEGAQKRQMRQREEEIMKKLNLPR
ncbi:MAG: rRNA maturation RNase YbeY [Oscillospiraceae bacterium]|nr:rRNA maturation RNase YbeY [Oscillospiraceae bacterium]